MEKNDLIYLAGHNGLVGSSIYRNLKKEGFNNILTCNLADLDLRNQSAVNNFFKKHEIDYVFLAAAKVGGILANDTYPAEFIYDNIMIQSNVIHAAYKNDIKKLEFLGSSCVYPKFAKQPITEDQLLASYLEPTNEPYAIAKIAGIKMCQYYKKQYDFSAISLMPTNLFGYNDNFHLENSHVLPALIRKFHEAKINDKKEVEIWGTGSPKREFLFIEDVADAAVFLMQNYDDPEIINVGTGIDLTIKDLALTIKKIVGFDGDLTFDTSKPDGTPRKLLDTSKLKSLGWSPKYSLEEGLKKTYEWFTEHYSDIISRER